jgi:purine catabolism regulator
LLIVNGFGIPATGREQVEYIESLARHRLAGIAISVRAPALTPELLATAERHNFPVLRIPRQVPFIELSYLVANASDRSARGRLSRHLEIFKTLRLRNSRGGDVATIYAQLERVSGYRLAVLSPAGRPLLSEWPRTPDDLVLHAQPVGPTELQVIEDGFIVPLVVGDRVTAYLVGQEHHDLKPGGLAALQHVSTLAVLDAMDDQRRREAQHREGGELFAQALDERADDDDLAGRLSSFGLEVSAGLRVMAFADAKLDRGRPVPTEMAVRDWMADRDIHHLMTTQEHLVALAGCTDDDIRTLVTDLGLSVGVSSPMSGFSDLLRMQRQAVWSLGLATPAPQPSAVFAEQQLGLARWLNPDIETLRHLSSEVLHPLREHDGASGSDLVRTLVVYFRHQGRLRPAAAQLFVHEHTLTYRLKRIEKLTSKSLKKYRDTFELWLAVEALPMSDGAHHP